MAWSSKEVSTYALIECGIMAVFTIIVASTMANVAQTMFWVPDLLAAFVILGTVVMYFKVLKRDEQQDRDRMLCALFTDLMVGIFLSLQVLFLGMRDLWATSAAGKVIALLFAFKIIAFWSVLCYSGYNAWYNDLPEHRKTRIVEAKVQRQQPNPPSRLLNQQPRVDPSSLISGDNERGAASRSNGADVTLTSVNDSRNSSNNVSANVGNDNSNNDITAAEWAQIKMLEEIKEVEEEERHSVRKKPNKTET